MNDTVAAVVSGAVADMIEVSTLNGQVLEPVLAGSLLQVKICDISPRQQSTSTCIIVTLARIVEVQLGAARIMSGRMGG